MKYDMFRSVDWIRCRLILALLGLILAGAGCGQTETIKPIVADCERTLVTRDSFQVKLLEYSPEANTIAVKNSVLPMNNVIMSAIFHCGSGQLIYGTLKRMSASAKAELTFKGVDREYNISLNEGFNMIIPLSDSEVLVETAMVKRGEIDINLGDISIEEGARTLPSEMSDQNYRVEDLPVRGQLYLEDIIFDAATHKEVRRIRGTIGRRDVNAGKIISYALDQTISEFDPKTGRRTRLHDYRNGNSFGATFSMLPTPTYYFSINHVLYAVAGSKTGDNTNTAYRSNGIYRYDQKAHKWDEETMLDFMINQATVDANRIIAIGSSKISVYDTKTRTLETKQMALTPFAPTSLVRVGANWALAVIHQTNDSDRNANDSQVWILSENFDRVLLKYPMKGFNVLDLTSSATPTPPRGWR